MVTDIGMKTAQGFFEALADALSDAGTGGFHFGPAEARRLSEMIRSLSGMMETTWDFERGILSHGIGGKAARQQFVDSLNQAGAILAQNERARSLIVNLDLPQEIRDWLEQDLNALDRKLKRHADELRDALSLLDRPRPAVDLASLPTAGEGAAGFSGVDQILPEM